jgi:hypothetical protein
MRKKDIKKLYTQAKNDKKELRIASQGIYTVSHLPHMDLFKVVKKDLYGFNQVFLTNSELRPIGKKDTYIIPKGKTYNELLRKVTKYLEALA